MMTANRFPLYSYRTRPRFTKGFSLIELMITLVLLSVLILIAIPSFKSFITSNRLTAQINELVADLSTARNMAASSSRRAYLCIATDSTNCAGSGTDWAAGWILWVDYNSDGSLTATNNSATNEIVKYVPALDGGVTLTAEGLPASDQITFQPYGGLTGTGSGTLTLCAPDDINGRQIALSYTGRALAKRITTCP